MAATITAAPASAGAGDPAADVIAAWSVFNRGGQGTFRTVLGTTMARGPGRAATRSTKPP